MVHNKIYFQSSQTGSPPKWKQFVKDAAAKGIPVYAIATDSMATIDDVQEFGAAGSRCNYRPTGKLTPNEMKLIDPKWQSVWGSYNLEVPTYNIYKSNNEAHKTYERAAFNHVEATLFKLPPTLDLNISTVSTWNEIRPYVGWNDTEAIDGFSGWADVIGWQAYYIGVELVTRKQAGLPWFRWAAFAFAGGNPDEGVWEAEGMLEYLKLAARHPSVLGVALHEYSFTMDIWREFGSRNFVGRFEKLFDACDKHDIPRPWVEIKEWGWEEADIPDTDTAMRHIKEVSAYYAKFPEIKFAAIWTTRKWHGGEDIHKKVQALAPHLYEFALSAEHSTPEPKPEPQPLPPQPTKGKNILQNGGFEDDWGKDKSHDALKIKPDGSIEQLKVGNIFTPPNWLVYFYHDEGKLAQPEVRDARHKERVKDGTKGQLLFTFFKNHHAGFLQTVPTVAGQQLQLSASAHAWSNHQDPDEPRKYPKPDEPKWSEGVGYGGNFILEGDTDDDASRNFTFRIGIDPTGGTDPASSDIVWGHGAHIYNEYYEVPNATTTATGDKSTVFVESKTLWPYKHNDAYWDSISLVASEPVIVPPVVEPPDETPLPPAIPLEQFIWETAQADVKVNPNAALQKEMYAGGYTIAGFERWKIYDDGETYAIQAAQNIETQVVDRAYVAKVPDWGDVFYVTYEDAYPPVKPPEPVELPKPPKPPKPNGEIKIIDIVDKLPKHTTKKYRKRDLAKATHIVIHHTVSPPDRPISSIASYHVSRGWPGIGYHYVISGSGDIYQTNYNETMSYHVGGQNHYAIGVSLQGNFQENQPPKAQIEAAASLVEHLKKVVPSISNVEPHRGMPKQATACPGNTWENWLWKISGDSKPEIAPSANTIDMAPYFSPPANRSRGDVFILSNNWGGGNERVQLQADNGKVFVTKNQQYEQRSIGSNRIHLELDTSPGGGEYYTVKSNTGWMPRHWNVGGRFRRVEDVKYHDKGDCKFKRAARFETDLLFTAHHKAWTSDSGITFADVVELAWEVNRGDGSTYIDERYWFARGYGLVGWQKHNGWKSWASELTQGQGNNVRETTGCL